MQVKVFFIKGFPQYFRRLLSIIYLSVDKLIFFNGVCRFSFHYVGNISN